MPVRERWYKDLIALPEYFKQKDFLDLDTIFCGSFTGKNSGFEYVCNNKTKTFDVYLNISLSDYEALNIQKRSDDLGLTEVYPYRKLSYSQALQRMFDDDLIDEGVINLEIDFITYENLYDLHAQTCITI